METFRAGWSDAPIGYSFEVMLGKMINAKNEVIGEISAPYLAAGSIQPEHLVLDESKRMGFSRAELRNFALRRDDIVVVEGGAGYGRSHLLKDDLVGWGFQNHVARVRQRSGTVLPGFLAYCLKACLASGYIEANNRTATLPSLSRDVLGALICPVPPLDEQRAITDYLDHETIQINILVAKQQGLIGLLRERRVAQIADAVEYGEPGTTLRRHVVGVRQGWSPNCESYPADGVTEWAVLKVGCSLGGVFRAEENKKLPPEIPPRPEHVVRRDEIVMSRSNTRELVGSVAVVRDDFPRLMLSDLNYGLTTATSLDPQFAVYALMTSRARSELMSRAKGTSPSMQKLAQRDILDIPLWVPDITTQQNIVVRLHSENQRVDRLIAKAQEHVALAKERRSALITAAVTGQLDVRTARKAS